MPRTLRIVESASTPPDYPCPQEYITSCGLRVSLRWDRRRGRVTAMASETAQCPRDDLEGLHGWNEVDPPPRLLSCQSVDCDRSPYHESTAPVPSNRSDPSIPNRAALHLPPEARPVMHIRSFYN